MEQRLSSQKGGQLEVGEQLLQEGDSLEVRIVGAWVAGVAAHDSTGWYLITRQNIPIRLQTGLVARFSCSSPPSSLLSPSAD